MNKRILALLFVLSLLVGFIYAQDYGGQEWEDMNWQEKWDNDPKRFMEKDKGLKSFSGAIEGVEYDDGTNSITNQGITLHISDDIKGADVEALEEGGFKVTKGGEITIDDNIYTLGEGQSVTLNKDGTVTIQKGSEMKTYGRTINPDGNVRIRSSKDKLTITGPAKITTEDGRIVAGNNLNLYFSETIPNKAIAQARQGNQVYLAKNNQFTLKGEAEIATTVDGITNKYIGKHPETIIWTGEGNIVSIRNPIPFREEILIAESEHGIAIKNTDTNVEEIKTIKLEHTSIEGKISISAKAISLGDLNDASKINHEVTKIPDVKIDVGDNNPFELDNPDFLKKNNLVANLPIAPKKQVFIEPTRPEEIKQGKVARFTIKQGPVTAIVEVEVNPEKFQELVAKYQGYSGPERDEKFFNELMNQEEFKISIESSIVGGGVTKAVGTLYSLFGKNTNPDAEIRKMLRETGKDAGLTGQDWENFDYIVKRYDVGGPPMIVDSSNPNNPKMSVGKNYRSISRKGVNNIRTERVGTLLEKEKIKTQLPKVTNMLLFTQI